MCKRTRVLCIVSVVILMNDEVIGTLSLCGTLLCGGWSKCGTTEAFSIEEGALTLTRVEREPVSFF